jgi:hypothetical protein
MRVVVFLCAALLSGTASASFAQVQPDSGGTPQIHQSVLKIMMEQEVHYSRHNKYADDATKLTLPAGLTAKIKSSNLARGYAVEATHADLGDGSCVFWVAYASADGPHKTRGGRAATTAGRVVCDDIKAKK